LRNCFAFFCFFESFLRQFMNFEAFYLQGVVWRWCLIVLATERF
jgi:hypothetical protein